MKFITKSADTSYLRTLKDLLEANGIPAVINGENTARVVTPFVMTQPSLWIYIDKQIDEALRLIHDPEYEVTNRVDVDEFYELANNITKQPTELNNALIHLGIMMGIIIGGLFILVKLLRWMAT